MKSDLVFENEAITLKSIVKWCEVAFCKLTKFRTRKKGNMWKIMNVIVKHVIVPASQVINCADTFTSLENRKNGTI